MKATEQYFPVVLFITLYKVVLTLNLEDKNLAKVDNSMKTVKQRFHLVLFVTLYKVQVLTFESVE